jgi:hypothetical protein
MQPKGMDDVERDEAAICWTPRGGVMAHTDIRYHATKLVVSALIVAIPCALFGDRESRAEQNAVPARSGTAAPSFSVLPPSGVLPVVVNIPPNVTTPEQARPYFDDFSWRSFIALNWPAVPDRHGVPKSPNDPKVFIAAGAAYPTVWGTYREAFANFTAPMRPQSPLPAPRRRTRCAGRPCPELKSF